MKENLLAITGVFFPHNETVTQISYKHLCNLDYNIDVATFKSKDDKGFKNVISRDSKFNKFNLHYINEDWRKTYIGKYNLNVFNIIKLINSYYKLCLSLISKKKYTVLYSNSVPNYTHYAAYKVKKKLGSSIRWYASFSDPIIDNPYVNAMKRKNIFTRDMVAYFLQKPLHYKRKYQKLTFKYADKLIFVSEQLRDYMTNKDPKLLAKSIVVPISYVEEWPFTKKLIEEKTKKNSINKKIKFIHFGNIYGLRNVKVFLNALFDLKMQKPEIVDLIEIDQYGYIEPNQYKLIELYNIQDIFKVHDRINYDECINIMKNDADVLLIFDTIVNNGMEQPFLPSKIMDYLLTQKPIFSVTMSNSPLFKIIGDKHICVANSIFEIKEGILTQLKKLDNVSFDYLSYENKKVIKDTLGKELKNIL